MGVVQRLPPSHPPPSCPPPFCPLGCSMPVVRQYFASFRALSPPRAPALPRTCTRSRARSLCRLSSPFCPHVPSLSLNLLVAVSLPFALPLPLSAQRLCRNLAETGRLLSATPQPGIGPRPLPSRPPRPLLFLARHLSRCCCCLLLSPPHLLFRPLSPPTLSPHCPSLPI